MPARYGQGPTLPGLRDVTVAMSDRQHVRAISSSPGKFAAVATRRCDQAMAVMSPSSK
jgi:hypothetical protein